MKVGKGARTSPSTPARQSCAMCFGRGAHVPTTSPLVSIIVPTHNSAKTIAQCLSSVREQTYQPIELIVVDNWSTDGTVDIARHWCDSVEVFGQERSAQRNRGASLAQGDYLFFVDSDMRLTPNVVRSCLDVLANMDAPAAVVPEQSSGDGFLAKCRA